MRPRILLADLVCRWGLWLYEHGFPGRALKCANLSLRIHPNLCAVWLRVFVAHDNGFLNEVQDDLDVLLQHETEDLWPKINYLIEKSRALPRAGAHERPSVSLTP